MKIFDIILALALATITNAAFERFWIEGQEVQHQDLENMQQDATCAEWFLNYRLRDADGDHEGYFSFDICWGGSNHNHHSSDGVLTIDIDGDTGGVTLTDLSSDFSMDGQIYHDPEGDMDSNGDYFVCYWGEGPDETPDSRWAPHCGHWQTGSPANGAVRGKEDLHTMQH